MQTHLARYPLHLQMHSSPHEQYHSSQPFPHPSTASSTILTTHHPSNNGVLSSIPRLPSSKLNRPSRSSSFHAAYAYPNGASNNTLHTISINSIPTTTSCDSHNSKHRHNHPLQIKIILRIHPNAHDRRQRRLNSLKHKRLIRRRARALLCTCDVDYARGCGCGEDSGAENSMVRGWVLGG